jgi:glutamate-ammonia-ligase adenylyltransferase
MINAIRTWRDPERAARIAQAMAVALGEDQYRALSDALARLLPHSPDADMALNNLERFLAAAPGSLPDLLGGGLEPLLTLLGTSQFFADVLVADSDFVQMLRVPLRHTPGPEELRRELRAEVDAAGDDTGVLCALRRFRRRHALRIGTNDVIHDRTLEEITLDISDVADAAIGVALDVALRTMRQRFSEPTSNDGAPAKCVVLAFGKLGGEELNYSSDIDLMLLYDRDGTTAGKSAIGNDEFFARVVGELVRLLSAHTDRGQAYRVDLRLRPEGRRGPPARSVAAALAYYDTLGRTWERQALIKLRPVAGDLTLGEEFLRSVEPFVYHRYLSFAEINDIKAMKRRIEQHTQRSGNDRGDVKTGRGGIRDIEFAVQFLQLLNGADLPPVRERNTLRAMQALEVAGCLNAAEFAILDDAYRFLRRVEHRLQLLFDLQTHRLPTAPDELMKLARRMGYRERGARSAERGAENQGAPRSALRAPRSFLDDAPPDVIDTRDLLVDPLDAFLHDVNDKTRLNRQVLDHLLHSTFADADEARPETDLILDPDPDESTIAQGLRRFDFRDVRKAYRNLTQLAQESVPFLSTPRCRHFLAGIAPALLRALADTPDPDRTLNNLEQVTASLGAKAVLWELFSFSPPSLRLTVELCAGSQLLSEILINNPGMIDDLLDSLVLNRPRTMAELSAELAELCRGAADVEPILHSFQDKELLRIGVGDLLGKSPIRETTAALSDLAEAVLTQVVTIEADSADEGERGCVSAPRTESVIGHEPSSPTGPVLRALAHPRSPAPYVILGLGKLGGREMSYHSDLDLVLIYDDNTPTDSQASSNNLTYFTELAQRVIRRLSQPGPMGWLYKVDMRLRPAGGAGSLATPLAEFARYFDSGSAQLWERQALTRARVVHGDADFAAAVMAEVRRCAFAPPWRPEHAAEIVAMRQRLEASRGPRDVKRGPGGQVDIEFLVQMFQLRHGATHPEICFPNTWAALDALRTAGLLSTDDYSALVTGYDFLRRVESRLRLMTNRALDEYPESAEEQDKLSRRLGLAGPAEFYSIVQRHTHCVRMLFEMIMRREAAHAPPGHDAGNHQSPARANDAQRG